MKKVLFFIIIIVLVLLGSIFLINSEIQAAELKKYDHLTYFGHTGQRITIDWEPICKGCRYQIRLKHFETGKIIKIGGTKKNVCTKTFKLPEAGHYIVFTRTIKGKKKSAWGSSVDKGKKENYRSWWLYAYDPPIPQK